MQKRPIKLDEVIKNTVALTLTPGQQTDAMLHEVTGYKTKDVSTSLDEAHRMLMQLLDEYLTLRCSIKWSRKKARWFCKLTDVWHHTDGTIEIKAIGKCYGTTLAASIAFATLRLYGFKNVKELVPTIPNNPRLENILNTPSFKKLMG
jgi:hypothetical protein